MTRKRTEVDEEAIRRMMAGDIPSRASGAAPEAASHVEPTVKAIPAPSTEPPRVKQQREKDASEQYASLYLRKREPSHKRQTYVSQHIYDKLARILAVVADQVSVPTFIDNVLSDHLERNRDLINEIYTHKIQRPL